LEIQLKKVWMYLYRAVDSEGNTLEFLLSPTRDAEAAKRFFVKALHCPAGSAPQTPTVEKQVTQSTTPADFKASRAAPRVINVDKNAAYPKAMAELKAAGILPQGVELRQVKYLNNLVEQDHRFIKRLTKPGLGFFSVETAWRTLQGYEVMHMIRKGQVSGVGKGDIMGQVRFILACLEWLPKLNNTSHRTLLAVQHEFLQHNLHQQHIKHFCVADRILTMLSYAGRF
jgi:IS6 family transposase